MVRFILITYLVVVDACMESIIISMYLFKLGQYLSYWSTHITLIKAMNVKSMNRGESNLAIFPCVLKSVSVTIRSTTGLSLAQLRIRPLAAICTLLSLLLCYPC